MNNYKMPNKRGQWTSPLPRETVEPDNKGNDKAKRVGPYMA